MLLIALSASYCISSRALHVNIFPREVLMVMSTRNKSTQLMTLTAIVVLSSAVGVSPASAASSPVPGVCPHSYCDIASSPYGPCTYTAEPCQCYLLPGPDGTQTCDGVEECP